LTIHEFLGMVAGVIDEVGDGVSEWKKGQRVGVG
jgi:D-arabinose 1-dehydrogenase-like Zn-dependent alcohol dehydrogenase